MAKKFRLVNQNWWFTTLLVNPHRNCPPLTRDIKCDVVIVGAGFAGVCGGRRVPEDRAQGGADRQEHRRRQLLGPQRRISHARQRARAAPAGAPLWREGSRRNLGRATLRHRAPRRRRIKKHDIQCGLLQAGLAVPGAGQRRQGSRGLGAAVPPGSGIHRPADLRRAAAQGHPGRRRATPPAFVTAALTASIRWPACRGSRTCWSTTAWRSTRAPRWSGSRITPSTRMAAASRPTRSSSRSTSWMSRSARSRTKCFHAQTFLSVTEPLTDKELQILFPSGEQMQCWDSKLVYIVLPADRRQPPAARRRHADHDLSRRTRSTVRASSARSSRTSRSHFPELSNLSFMQFWPGQIDATRDLLPTIAKPPGQPHVRFIFGCGGHSVGGVHRQLRRAQHPRRGGRGLPEVLQLLLQRSQVLRCRAASARSSANRRCSR